VGLLNLTSRMGVQMEHNTSASVWNLDSGTTYVITVTSTGLGGDGVPTTRVLITGNNDIKG